MALLYGRLESKCGIKCLIVGLDALFVCAAKIALDQ